MLLGTRAMWGLASRRKRAKSIMARPSTDRFTAKRRWTRPGNCTRRESNFTLSRFFRTIRTDFSVRQNQQHHAGDDEHHADGFARTRALTEGKTRHQLREQ